MNRRISFVIADLDGGGAERVFVMLANEFVRTGHAVDLVLIRARGPYLSEVNKDVRVVNLDANRSLLGVWPFAKYLRSTRPDVILSTLLHVNAMTIVGRFLAGSQCRLVIRESTTQSSEALYYQGIVHRLLLLSLSRIYPLASCVICPSIGIEQDLAQNFGLSSNKLAVINNPVDLLLMDTLADASCSPGSENLAPFILALGRLEPQKDFHTLIKAYAKVRMTTNVRLVILGEGMERKSLVHLIQGLGIQDSVMMPGFVTNPFPYMKQASAFVLSSRYEGFPNSLIQAVSMGVPVVATDCPSGPREILEDGRWGRLVSVGDVDAMAQGILDALRGNLDTPPRSLMEARYGVKRIANQYLSRLFPENDPTVECEQGQPL